MSGIDHKDAEKILTLLDESKSILAKEPPILNLNEDRAIFVGDIHGDLNAWKRIKKIISNRSIITIFLGDYVDRGFYSTEIINDILYLKNENPEQIILLRGNHETEEINRYYGFLSELEMKFRKRAHEIYRKYNDIFAQFPFVALMDDNKVVALHGGIPIEATNIRDFYKLKKGDFNPTDSIALQILWNDPDDNLEYYAPSPRGPGIYLFGRKIFQRFMINSKAEYLIRAHLFLIEGIRKFFDGKLISIFSTINYVGNQVAGKVLEYRHGNFYVIDL